MSETSSGSSKTPKTIGKNYFAMMDDYYLQYPVQRSADGGEDSLLIQCVDYKPPMQFHMMLQQNMNKIMMT